jgi:hypothetical protein
VKLKTLLINFFFVFFVFFVGSSEAMATNSKTGTGIRAVGTCVTCASAPEVRDGQAKDQQLCKVHGEMLLRIYQNAANAMKEAAQGPLRKQFVGVLEAHGGLAVEDIEDFMRSPAGKHSRECEHRGCTGSGSACAHGHLAALYCLALRETICFYVRGLKNLRTALDAGNVPHTVHQVGESLRWVPQAKGVSKSGLKKAVQAVRDLITHGHVLKSKRRGQDSDDGSRGLAYMVANLMSYWENHESVSHVTDDDGAGSSSKQDDVLFEDFAMLLHCIVTCEGIPPASKSRSRPTSGYLPFLLEPFVYSMADVLDEANLLYLTKHQILRAHSNLVGAGLDRTYKDNRRLAETNDRKKATIKRRRTADKESSQTGNQVLQTVRGLTQEAREMIRAQKKLEDEERKRDRKKYEQQLQQVAQSKQREIELLRRQSIAREAQIRQLQREYQNCAENRRELNKGDRTVSDLMFLD